MQGLVLAPEVKVSEVVAACLAEGLVVISAEGNVLRMLPPLVINEQHIDEMLTKITKVLA